jgi:hypothetical protein
MIPLFFGAAPLAASLGSGIAASAAAPAIAAAAAGGTAAASKAAAIGALLAKAGAAASTAAGVGGTIASMVNKPKMSDPYNPVQSSGNAPSQILGGGQSSFTPLQKGNMQGNKYEAVQQLMQGGY